jgi:DNA-binding PadR family transcriptional regulator
MLLQIISQAGEVSGYKIHKLVEEREYRVWADIGTTSIYTGLEKLRKKRLVISWLDRAKRGKGPLPKKFRLTEKGHQTLRREIEQALSSTRERDRRFDLALAAIPLVSVRTVRGALQKRKTFLGEVAEGVEARFEFLGGENLPINIKELFKHSMLLVKHELEFIDALLVDLKRR